MERKYFILNKTEEFNEGPVKFIISILKFNKEENIIDKLINYANDIIVSNEILLVNHIVFSYNDIYKDEECIIDIPLDKPKGLMKIIQLKKLDNCKNLKLKAFIGSIFSEQPEKYLGIDDDIDIIIHKSLEMDK